MYLTINEKFAVEAKSTKNKLGNINAGRLQLHRNKINAKYTIVVSPYFMPSVESDIKNTVNVMITASSLSNFLYQSYINSKEEPSYDPLHSIIMDSMGSDISSKVNDFIAKNYGIGKRV